MDNQQSTKSTATMHSNSKQSNEYNRSMDNQQSTKHINPEILSTDSESEFILGFRSLIKPSYSHMNTASNMDLASQHFNDDMTSVASEYESEYAAPSKPVVNKKPIATKVHKEVNVKPTSTSKKSVPLKKNIVEKIIPKIPNSSSHRNVTQLNKPIKTLIKPISMKMSAKNE